ncbi:MULTISPECIES: ABC transporter ATP-binding protein [unclassified Corynebacterium]|uniref:ABC transporter ATP-binding protein n=1 Tax=unclassified Corynebacterium TaxID=2624378 RepID=UPI0026564425|nr:MULTISPECIES: ABC transporter ATP-binding protein [unclassified Corynebacterium]MDN8594825.1 ABC transporter ATP-binding protein [Corynebacterium sp. P4_F2]WKK56327.1 ABC transporter ATP-binding protein [Corynebacterium sp. P4-C1]WKK63760.1 ABC transporter ATP-binding protein [Corynebacterium sp. P8-C1]
MKANPGFAALTLATAVIAAVLQTSLPGLTGTAVDVATGAREGSVAAIAWTMAGIAVAQFAFQVLRRWAAGNLATRSQHYVRVELLKTLHRLDGPGQDRIVTGQIVSRSITDLGQLFSVLAMSPMALSRLVQLLLTIAVMAWVDVPLTLMALAFLPLIVWVAGRSRTALYAATWANQQSAADLTSHVEQTVSGVRVVKAFGREEHEVAVLDGLARHLYAVKMRAAKLTARFQPALSQLPNLALVVTIVAGGLIALRGGMTVGGFVAFTAYLSSLTSLMSMLANTYVTLQMGMSGIDRLEEVLQLAPERPDPAAPRELPDGPAGIAFNDVTFRADGRDVLDRFTLTVAPGEQVSVIGPAGAGKSMAVQLAGGFYAPDEGYLALVTPDGEIPYDELTHNAIRSKVTCVFDEAFLFSLSIRDNIAMGADVTDDDIAHAARMACADEFIADLPDGYSTVVGERGLTLSGGQRQRIALARALLARPRVLILDDATSAIDATTEADILANLHDNLPGVTIIAVAHRQSTVEHTERVLIMDHGAALIDAPRATATAHPSYKALMAPGETPQRDVGVGPGLERVSEPEPEPEPPHSALWPELPNVGPHEHVPAPSAGFGRVGGGGGGGGAARVVTATPELLECLEHLPPADEEPKGTIPAGLRAMFSSVKWLIAGVTALLVVGVLADLSFPTLVRTAVDKGIHAGDPRTLWLVSGAALAVVLIAWLANAAMTVLSARSGERLLYGLRVRSYSHLQSLGMSYFESHLSGRIMTRMTTDIDTLSSFLQTGLAQAIVSVGTLIGVAAMLVATDGSLALTAFYAVPLIALVTIVFRHYSKRFHAAARAQISAVNGEFAELIGGIRISQMHRMEPSAEVHFAAESDTYRRLRMRSQLLVATYFNGMQLISQIMTAIIVGIGAGRIADGTLSVGVLVAFTMYLGQLYGPIQQLGQIFDSWQQATVSFDRIRELLDERTTVPDTGTSPGAADAARGELALNNVTFAYSPGTTPVIEDFTVAFQPGETVALVGATGAGKSTVVKLLARFYDPVTGTVTASGTDVSAFPLPDWRRALAQVPQESYLFPGTVAENIAYGAPDAAHDEIEEAVRRIGALGIIAAIPGGFNARVGERGRGLSSGQRQIIALARAEMLHPDVVLLDEATATLDPATERSVLDASAKTTVGRTSVIVAHRLATAAEADRILVVDQGRIIEDGPHADLLKQAGHYAVLWAVSH